MKNIVTSILTLLVLTVLLGLLYPLAVWAVAQLCFPFEARGSLLVDAQGVTRGSALIGQPFAGERFFHGRPSAAGGGYDATASGGSNLGPTARRLIARIDAATRARQAENLGAPVPADLVTTSASGLDPHISPAAAEFQIPRVARARGLDPDALRRLVAEFTEDRQLGLFGEPRVNVLRLNLALEDRAGR